MIADLKPYAEYKESGLPWLGRVPVHWGVVPSKSLFRHRKEKARTDDQMLTASQAHGIIARDEFMAIEGRRVMHVFTGADILKHVEPNDFVMSMRSFQGGLEWSKVRGAISSAYVMLIPTEHVHPPYYARLLKSTPYIVALRRTSDLVRDGQALRYANFGQVPLPRVPRIDQEAIVRFLDWANGRLERAIRAKRKVIALLNEQKQAIIHRAVTRGLDPSVPLKPSESRWFPELPAGWEALTLRRVITSAIDGPHFSPQYLDAGIPFLSARNVRADRWILGGAKFISESDYIEFSRRVRPEVGDVLYTKGGTTGVARVVDLTFPFQVWVHIAVLKLKRDRMVPAFLSYCLNSPRCYEQAQLFTRGATNQDLGLGRMKDIELPIPPTLDEQNAIVGFLDFQCSAFTTAIARLEREIELLREYRTRLVADVVTGKLDVREAAARLPDEAPLESIEDDTDLGDETEATDEGAAI